MIALVETFFGFLKIVQLSGHFELFSANFFFKNRILIVSSLNFLINQFMISEKTCKFLFFRHLCGHFEAIFRETVTLRQLSTYKPASFSSKNMWHA